MRRSAIVWGAVGFTLVGAVLGGWLGRMQPVNHLRTAAQMDFLEGYALLRIATGPGTASPAVRKDWYNQGLEALVLSQEPLTESGVHGMSSVVNYLQGTGYVLVQGHASAHQKAVFHVFLQSFAPFRNDNFGTVSDAALQQAFNRVNQAINR